MITDEFKFTIPSFSQMYPGIGNRLGNENSFLLTIGILWFRVHNYWAQQLRKFAERLSDTEREDYPEYFEDEWLYNRARQLTIATHQHIVYTEWLPILIPRKLPNGLIPYTQNEGYSLQNNMLGYNPAINPQIAHIFQSAAMRFGHTMVTPGMWRRQRV